MANSIKRNTALKYAAIYGGVIIALIGTLFPFYWMLKSSFTPDAEIYSLSPSLIPTRITFEHYRILFRETTFMRYFMNSVYVALAASLIGLTVSVLGSYAMTRLRWVGRNFLARGIVLSYLLPTAVLFIPMYIMISRIGLGDNKNSLVIVYQTFIIPYCCYMLMSYFRAIPISLEEAALIDGCSRRRARHRCRRDLRVHPFLERIPLRAGPDDKPEPTNGDDRYFGFQILRPVYLGIIDGLIGDRVHSFPDSLYLCPEFH